MIRILIVLAIVALVAVYLGAGSGKDQAERRPEVQYERQVDKVEALETQLQEQTKSQLEDLDAATSE